MKDFKRDTLKKFFDNILLRFQSALLALIEKWKKNLDDKGYGGAVLMDLSKAFDTLNHDLLVAKLGAYGFEHEALKLTQSYFNKQMAQNEN